MSVQKTKNPEAKKRNASILNAIPSKTEDLRYITDVDRRILLDEFFDLIAERNDRYIFKDDSL